jgi:hypothetical protein
MGRLEVFVDVNSWAVPRGVQGVPEQSPAHSGAAERRIDHEQLDEVAPEEKTALHDHEPGHGPVADIHLAFTELHRVPEELGSFAVVRCGEVIGTQNAVQVASDSAADPGRHVRHWLTPILGESGIGLRAGSTPQGAQARSRSRRGR